MWWLELVISSLLHNIIITTQSKFTNWKPYQLWLQTAFGQESPLLFVHTMVLNPFLNRTVLVSLYPLAMACST